MINYNFWRNWKNKTVVEQRAIEATKKARKLVINSVPADKLIAIYIKGSFARREMRNGSDVDMVPIVSENKYEGAVFSVNSRKISPVMAVPLSLWELKNNKLFTKSNIKPDLRAKPDRLLKKIKEYRLIYGRPLNPKKFKVRDDKRALRDEMGIVGLGYIPAYEKRKIKFNPLLKEVFWLVELEQSVLGKKIIHSFRGIDESVSDASHIIHDAFGLRKNPLKNKEKAFILKLKRHLIELKKTI